MVSANIARLRAQVKDLESELTEVKKERGKFHEELSQKRTEVATLTSLSETQASKIRELERQLERIQRDAGNLSEETRLTTNSAEVGTSIAVKQESTSEDNEIEIIDAPPSQPKLKKPLIQSPPSRENGAKTVSAMTETQDSREGDSDVEIIDGPSVLASQSTALPKPSNPPSNEIPSRFESIQGSVSIPKKRASEEKTDVFKCRSNKRMKVESVDEETMPAAVVRKRSQSTNADLLESFKPPPTPLYDDVPLPGSTTPVQSLTLVKSVPPVPTTFAIGREPCALVNLPPASEFEDIPVEAEVGHNTEDSFAVEAAPESPLELLEQKLAQAGERAQDIRQGISQATVTIPTVPSAPSLSSPATPRSGTAPLLLQRRLTGPGTTSPQGTPLTATTTPPSPPCSTVHRQSSAVPMPTPSCTLSAPELAAPFTSAAGQTVSRDPRVARLTSSKGIKSNLMSIALAGQPSVVRDGGAATTALSALEQLPHTPGPSKPGAVLSSFDRSWPEPLPMVMNTFSAHNTPPSAGPHAPTYSPSVSVRQDNTQLSGSTGPAARPKSTLLTLTSASLPPGATADEIAEAIAAAARSRFPCSFEPSQHPDALTNGIPLVTLVAATSRPPHPYRISKPPRIVEHPRASTHWELRLSPQQCPISPVPTLPPAPPPVPEQREEYKLSTFLSTHARLPIAPPPQLPMFASFPRHCIAKWYGGADARGVTFTTAKKGWPHLFLDRENCPCMPLEPGDSAIVIVSHPEHVPAVTAFFQKSKGWWTYGGEYTCVMRPLPLEEFRKLNKQFKRRFMWKYILDKRFRARLRAPEEEELPYAPVVKSERLETLRAIHNGEEGSLFVGFLECTSYEHNFAADLDARYKAFLSNPLPWDDLEEDVSEESDECSEDDGDDEYYEE